MGFEATDIRFRLELILHHKTIKTTKLKKVVCEIIFILFVDCKCFSLPRNKNEEMSEYDLKYTLFSIEISEVPNRC